MKQSWTTGLSFGLTSGIITTLGLMVGLYSGTHSRLAVIGGILTIAIADAFSDALGIHISEESQKGQRHKAVWEATVATFFSKFLFALTFVVPVLLLELKTAIYIGVVWGLVALGGLNYFIAKIRNKNPWMVVGEHLLIAILVVIVTYFAGIWIGAVFG
ncbi:hypothetical protein HOC13_03115 [Candidatus Woesearchaeota archaeon]|jgi:vacuolar iron transporter family protein|nr:hypothetical protein [Candidatus Woesearchaeota archaeon]